MEKARATIQQRQIRAARTKARLNAANGRDRLVVHRSNLQIYAQIIRPDGTVAAAADSLKLKRDNKTELAKQVGEAIAKAAVAKDITEVVFDRKHYRYHGRVRALAEAAREAGLKF